MGGGEIVPTDEELLGRWNSAHSGFGVAIEPQLPRIPVYSGAEPGGLDMTIGASPEPVQSSISDADLLARWESANAPKLNILGNAVKGVVETPSSLLRAVGSIPSGVSNVYNSIVNPIDSANDGTLERTIRGTGGLAAGASGAMLGGALGAFGGPAAPITVPLGAAVGGALGLFGYGKGNQLTGMDAPTSLTEDANSFAYNTTQGLTGTVIGKALGAGAKAAGKGISSISKNLAEKPQILTEDALGVKYGDRALGLGKSPRYVDAEGNVLSREQMGDAANVIAPIQEQIGRIKDKGYLEGAPDKADALKTFVDQKKNVVGQRIGDLSKEADAALGGKDIDVTLTFPKARAHIRENYTASTQAVLNKALDQIIEDYKVEPGAGFKKLTKFTDKLQNETKFDQATPEGVNKLKLIAQHELVDLSNRAYDQIMPEKAGAFADANADYSALSSVNKTLAKKAAKVEPSLLSFTTGGSKPAAIATGVLSPILGVPIAAGVAGTTLLAHALRRGYEAKYPLSSAEFYKSIPKGALNAVDTAGEAIKATGEAGSKVSPMLSALTNSAANGRKVKERNSRSSTTLQGTKQTPAVVPSPDYTTSPKDTKVKRSEFDAAMKPIGNASLDAYESYLKGDLSAEDLSKVALNPDDKMMASLDPKMLEGSPTPKPTPIPSQLNNLSKKERVEKVSSFIKEQPPLIQAIIKTESSGDPFAQSPTGPLGLMQLTRMIGKAYGAKDRLDPRQNVKAGTAFLQDLADKYEDPKVILAAYNQGETEINKAIKKAKSTKWDDIKDFLTEEGQTYPDKVIRNITEV